MPAHFLRRRRHQLARQIRLALEPLEPRRLLTNRIVLDFTPDRIDNEYQVGRFLDLFDGSAVNSSNRLLNYNSDGVIDAKDAQLAARKIGNRVTSLLSDIADESDVDVRVLYTTNLTATDDPGQGELSLARGQDSLRLNSYVVYVGLASPLANLRDQGMAIQAYQGENAEHYSFVFAKSVKDYLTSGQYPWKAVGKLTSVDFTNNMAYAIAHELGHLWGLGHLRDNDADIGDAHMPNQYHHIMNYPKYSNPDLARFRDDAVHPMLIGLSTGEEVYQHVNARDEVHASLATDVLGFFDQTTVPNDETGPLPRYQPEGGTPFFAGDDLPSPAPATTTPAASQGTRGTTSAAQVASMLDTGLDTFRTELLDDFAGRLNLPQSALPLISSQLGDLLDLTAGLTTALGPVDLSGTTTLALLQSRLTAAGFTVNQVLTDAQLAAAPANLPIDFVRASRTYSLADLVRQAALDGSALSALGDLAHISLSGQLDVLADVYFTLTVGVDSAGFYLVPGNGLYANIAVGGNVSAEFAGGGTVAGNATVGLASTALLTTNHADGRVRLEDLAGDFTSATPLELTGGAGMSLNFTVSVGDARHPVRFGGDWLWDLDPQGQAFTLNTAASGFNTEELLDSLVEVAAQGVQQLASEASNLARMARPIPVIGDELQTSLTSILQGQFTYQNDLGSAREYLAERGFNILSVASPGNFLDGSFLTQDLVRLQFEKTVAPAPIELSVDGALSFDAGGVPLRAALGGQLQFSPRLDLDFTFGVNCSQGAYLVEGSGIVAQLPVTGTVTGNLNVGDLVGIQVSAAANYATSASVTLNDYDSDQGEPLEVGNFTVGGMVRDHRDSADPSGGLHLDLALTADTPASDLPVIGKFLADALTWYGTIDYHVDTGLGSYAIDESRLPSLANLEQQLRDEILELVDPSNPLPQNFRDLLTQEIEFLGGALPLPGEDKGSLGTISLAKLLGFESAEILINPDKYIGQSTEDVNHEEGEEHVTLKYDFATPGNVINLLLGKPASLFSLDIEQKFTGINQTIPIAPQTPLATFFGLVSLLGEVDLEFELGAAVDMVLGLDTQGFYVLDEADVDAFQFFGAIGADVIGTGNIVGIDVVEVTADVDLEATGGIDLVSPRPNDPRIRANELFYGGLPNPQVLEFGLGLELVVEMMGKVGIIDVGPFDVDLSYETQPVPVVRYPLYELRTGGQQPGSDKFESFRNEMGRRVRQAMACEAAILYPNIATVGACAYYSAPDIQDAMDRAVDWAEERWGEVEDAAQNAWDDAVEKARQYGGQIADAAQNFANQAERAAQDAYEDARQFIGHGDWHAVTPQVRHTFTTELAADGTLTVVWLEGHVASKLNLRADNGEWSVPLPPGYPSEHVTISSNGWVRLDDGLRLSILEDDLTTAELGDDIFWEPSPTTVSVVVPNPEYDPFLPLPEFIPTSVPEYQTIRWNATNKRDGSDVNFSVDLYQDGRVVYKYGQGNTNLQPRVGRSQNGFFFTAVATHDMQSVLTDAAAVLFVGSNPPALDASQILRVRPAYDLLDQDDDRAAQLAVYYETNHAGQTFLVVEGPDFYSNEVVEQRKSGCWDGCETEDKYGAVLQSNRVLEWIPVDDPTRIERIVFSLSNSSDSVILADDVSLPVEIHALGGDDLIGGGPSSDTIYGGTGNDVLSGGGGDDTLRGDAGHDTLLGGLGNDTLEGGDGDDQLIEDLPGETSDRSAEVNTLRGAGGSDRLFGGPGPDTLDGGRGQDFLFGGFGNDTLYGDQGVESYALADETDYLEGNEGDDTLHGGVGEDLIVGGLGHDTLYGGRDNDELHGDDADSKLAGNDTLHGDAGDDVLHGGRGTDQLYGGAGADVLRGGDDNDLLVGALPTHYEDLDDGNDALYGGPGADTLYAGPSGPLLRRYLGAADAPTWDLLDGGEGADQLFGGSGPDRLAGGDGVDRLEGGDGEDLLAGDSGADTLLGGDGNDRLYGIQTLVAGAGLTMDGGAGDDQLVGSPMADLMIGGPGQDGISGLGGNDTAYGHSPSGDGDDAAPDVIYGDDGDDTLYGQGGNDEIHGDDEAASVAGNDTLHGGAGDDVLQGGQGVDELFGDAGADVLGGGDGADQLYGGSGPDRLTGGAANDHLEGGDGEDELHGDEGDDTLDGGSGADTLHGDDGDDLLEGSSGADVLHGDSGDDTLDGGSDSDTLYGDRGNDLLEGNSGEDVLFGGRGLDRLYGHLASGLDDDAAADTLAGDEDDDFLFGQAGADHLTGGLGRDWLWGGVGDDQLFGELVVDAAHPLAGADFLFGDDGNDQLHGGGANDALDGGSGHDQLSGDGGDDRLDGGLGDDLARGGAGDDIVYGGWGLDTLHGDAGDDYLDGGADRDTLYGGAGNDFLVAGAGLGDALYGDDGDDRLTGTDEGAATDPDFFDTTYFGDRLDGGAGHDTLDGLGGADLLVGGDGNDQIDSGSGSDYVLAGGGNDWVFAGHDTAGDSIYGGAGDDQLYGSHLAAESLFGEAGRDRLYGQDGTDTLSGGDDDDYLDGGAGTDTLDGDAGNDELVGGGGAGDTLRGSAGDDVLRGSDDGADILLGGAGRDLLFGNGGNDHLDGEAGDDILHGGSGDDTLAGGPGSDLALGQADHDTLHGHHATAADDDGAVDYLYGDFGTNGSEPGAGRDQLFGQGGNDHLFGEADDDALEGGAGADNRLDFGTGEGPVPADLVPPAATPAPTVLSPGAPLVVTTASLPVGAGPHGRWSDLYGSAADAGLSGGPSLSVDSSIAVGPLGTYVAWADARQGNFEIYVARSTPAGWQAVGPSISGGGVSQTTTSSRRPQLSFDAAGQPMVAWTELTGGGSQIYARRWDPAAPGGGQWVELAGSASGAGLSLTGAADDAQIVATGTGPVVAWRDRSSGAANVYARRFDGAGWVPLAASVSGLGISAASGGIGEFVLATSGSSTAVAWTEIVAGRSQVRLREFNGSAWVERGGSASGDGVSHSIGHATNPALAYLGTELFVAWQSLTPLAPQGTQIFAARHTGSTWLAAGAGATSGAGVSQTDGNATSPRLAASGGVVQLVWLDDRRRDIADRPVSLHARVWNGSQFVDQLAGDAQGAGASALGDDAGQLGLALSAGGQAAVTWFAPSAGQGEIFVRENSAAIGSAGQVFVADAAAGTPLQSVLDEHDLQSGDTIVVRGLHAQSITIGDQDSGVLIVGEPGARVGGSVTISAASSVTIQRLAVEGTLTVNSASQFALIDSTVGSVALVGGSGGLVRESRAANVTLQGTSDTAVESTQANSLTFGGGVSGAAVRRSQIGAVTFQATAQATLAGNRLASVVVAGASSGSVIGNELQSLEILAPFSGSIAENDIQGGAIGVTYRAAATLVGNRIRNHHTGVVVDWAAPLEGLGFVGVGAPNRIEQNQVGIEIIAGRVQNQHVVDNVTGFTGAGVLGGEAQALANVIERNDTGARFVGTIQFNHFVDNAVAIAAQDHQTIAHNEFDRNRERGVSIVGRTDVRLLQNTFYAATGDHVRLEDGSREVELRGNILWAESGYDVYVADDSQAGFFSDFNTLHASGSGKLVHWGYDFTDILDWQADVAQFDLHSLGTTVVHPEWSAPRLVSRARGDLGVFNLAARQRFSSPTLDAADPLLDQALFTGAANLLTNPGFEQGLDGWTTPDTVSTGAPAGWAYEGTRHLTVGDTAFADAIQTIDLQAAGFTPGELDAGNLTIAFGGRIRSGAKTLRDFGQIRLVLLDELLDPLASVASPIVVAADRWALAGERTAIPTGARFARYEFGATRQSGATNDVKLDNAFVYVLPTAYAPDQGAAGATQHDSAASQPAYVALRFPDLYVDWERDVPHDIRWDVPGDGTTTQVRIDLMQDGPDGPQLLVPIAAATANDGQFSWTPADSGIGFGTRGLRIQVTAVDNPTVFTRSTEPFVVPENTTTFYANDRSVANDEYTTAAGNNRNTGKLATAPKPGPAHLLRTYALGPTHTLLVDTGTYLLFDTMVLSGNGTLGDDEAFTLTGPTGATRSALLRHAIPSTQPLVELNDADLVTVAHLTLESGTHGVWIHRDSAQFIGHHLTLPNPIDSGIRLEDGSSATSLHHITVTGSGGDGLMLAGPVGELTDLTVTGSRGRGVIVTGHIDRLSDSVVSGSQLAGIELLDSGGALVQRNHVFENRGAGIIVNNRSSGDLATVGSGDLTLGLGNRVHDNLGDGIAADGLVLVAGNAVQGQRTTGTAGIAVSSSAVARRNVSLDNYHGLIVGGVATVEDNRVYESVAAGILLLSGGTVRRNVVYSNDVGIQRYADYHVQPETIANNLIYANDRQGILLQGFGAGAMVVNNTVDQPAGGAVSIEGGASDITLRNNILSVGAGYALSVASDSQLGFASDFNLFDTTGSGRVAQWQNTARPTLTAWQSAAQFDQNSRAQDPRFVDRDGADGLLGFATAVQDGRDDDYHLQSQFGSLHGGSFAPALSAGTGLPILLTATLATDAAQSPGIDRGHAAHSSADEPAPNGGYINLGAYGGTSQASLSPDQYVTVFRPDGHETWPADRTFAIRWRSSEVGGTVDIALMESDGAGGFEEVLRIAEDTDNDGEFAWPIPAGIVPGQYYVEITTLANGLLDRSNAAFTITGPVTAYYVNDPTDANPAHNEYTTAPGDDGNDGLSPGSPKASLAALLAAYDLDPGDIVYVDSGRYELSANVTIEPEDSGVWVQGPVGAGHAAEFDRGNPTGYAVELLGADDVTLSHLTLTGAAVGVFAGADAGSDRLHVLNSDIFDHVGNAVEIYSGNADVLIAANRLHDNGNIGVSVIAANAIVRDNRVYGNTVGINAQGNPSESMRPQMLHNVVFDNYYQGIDVIHGLVADNVVYGHQSDPYSIGIAANEATVRDNVVYANGIGIHAHGGSVEANRAYDNRVGITASSRARAVGNVAYANAIGISAASDGNGFLGEIINNLAYANSQVGIEVRDGRLGASVTHNTVYQPVGDAIQLLDGTRSTPLRNNVLWVASGAALHVAANSQSGFISDYNLFHRTGSGRVARWGNLEYVGLDAFSLGVGSDQHSFERDPGFVNPAGADTLLGFNAMQLDTPRWVDDASLAFATSSSGTATWYFLQGQEGDFLLGSGLATVTLPSYSMVGGETYIVHFAASWPSHPTLGVLNFQLGINGPASPGSIQPAMVDQSTESSVSGSATFSAIEDGEVDLALQLSGNNIHLDQLTFQVTNLDDGDDALVIEGDWRNHYYDKNVHRAHNEGAAAAGRWTVDGVVPGDTIAIHATWDPAIDLGTHVRYEVWDGDTLVGLRWLNQTLAPDDPANQRHGNANLGYYRATTDTFVVKVESEPDTDILADAVRVTRIPGDHGIDDNFHVLGHSPTIDQGDPRTYYLAERQPSGARANIGFDGNTGDAAVSLVQTLQVQSPNGGERLEAGNLLHIDWLSSGIVAFQPVALINAAGGAVDNWLVDNYRTTAAYELDLPAEQRLELSQVTDPAPSDVYRSYLQTDFASGQPISYRLPVPDGSYKVRLHFVEPDSDQLGLRVFDIRLQDTLRRDDYDLVAEAGGPYTATIEEFDVTAVAGQGIALDLAPQTDWSPVISAIEVLVANPQGVAAPTADVELSLDNGASWTTIATEVPFDRYGRGRVDWPISANVESDGSTALARVRYAMREDQSDRPFLIANGGTRFYVNVAGDLNLTNNEYTTAAGDDRHSGKSPDRPMASLAALLRAYDLEPGDTIYVDTGVYTLPTNIVLGADDSGVTIQGPVAPGHAAVLDRANQNGDYYVFELNGADDVTLSHLTLTGAASGIFADTATGSDRLHVVDCDVYGHRSSGVTLLWGNADAILARNTIHDNTDRGLLLRGENVVAIDNEVYANDTGIYLQPLDSSLPPPRAINNEIHHNVRDGITAMGGVAEGNRIYGHRLDYSAGISASGAQVYGNTLFDNTVGVRTYRGVTAENRVYGNQTGIVALADATVDGNRVYSNDVGISAASDGNGFLGRVTHNVVFANAQTGIEVRDGRLGTTIDSNTVYQRGGRALHVLDGSSSIRARNNILSVTAGHALLVELATPVGFDSDYNLFHLTGTAQLARYQTFELTDLAEWSARVGTDRHSLVADPRFVDIDGADNQLGLVGGVDRGLDDNFRVQSNSPAIDRGDPWSYYLAEPAPNGGRINIGSDGNTSSAAASPALGIQVLAPNGGERLEAGESTEITWHTDGLTAVQPVALVNAGGPTLFPWLADAYGRGAAYSYSIPIGEAIDLAGVSNPAPEDVYRDYVLGAEGADWALLYQLPVPDGVYEVRLHFVEPDYAEGDVRVFDVQLQGVTRLDNFDLPVAAGGMLKAVARNFAVTAAGGTGIALAMRSETGVPPVLSGIEITRANTGGATNVTANVDLSLDHGQTWTTLTTELAVDRLGFGHLAWDIPANWQSSTALVRVTTPATQVGDVSDAAVIIAPAGHDFYVNDAVLSGDVLTTAAGNNALHGKSPAAPMADLFALVSSYDLGPDDVIHVDRGTYDLIREVTLTSQDSGVRIEGAGRSATVLDRRHGASLGDYVFRLVNADDVTIARLGLTGAAVAVETELGQLSERLALLDNEIYGTSSYGIRIWAGDEVLVQGNRIHDTGELAGVSLDGGDFRVVENELFANHVGIEVNRAAGNAASEVVGNTVHDNSSYGILVGAGVLVDSNAVYHHTASAGILGTDGTTTRNVVYDNQIGIVVEGATSAAVASENRVYANEVGIWLRYYQGRVERNSLYSNNLGIRIDGTQYDEATVALVADNLLYDHTNGGMLVVGGSDVRLVNNTFYQAVGDAIRIEGGTQSSRLANNVLWVDAGHAISVASNSQSGFASDFNLFFRGPDPSARIGFWDGADRDLLDDWRTATGWDGASQEGDPLFVDRNGADNRLGYDAVLARDGGADDNFHLAKTSPAIDRGNTYASTSADREANPRRDDAGTANAGSLTYFESTAPGVVLDPTAGEVAQGWNADEWAWLLPLPFAFSYFSANYSHVWVYPDGLLQFGDLTPPTDVDGDLASAPRIAALWDDLYTDGVDDDIFVDSSSSEVLIRWQASRVADDSDVNLRVVLRADGTIRFDYGSGNTGLSPIVGLSDGLGRVTLASYHGRDNLGNAASLEFASAPGIVDRGAFEFQGSTFDTTPPQVVDSRVVSYDGPSPRSEIHVTFSEAVDPIDARAPSNYELWEAGPNSQIGDGDDVALAVAPRYEAGSRLVVLDVLPAGTQLVSGRYRLVVHGDSTIHDQSGLRLDGDANGSEGGNFSRSNSPPVLDPLANRTIDEGQLLDLLPTATDPDGNTLTFELGLGAPAGATIDPQTGRFQWRPTEAQAPGVYLVTIRVFDDGQPSFSMSQSFEITAREVNDPPAIAAIANQAVQDSVLLELSVSASDPEGDAIRYSLDSPPAGATIDSATGRFRWTPAESQSPGSFTITVRAMDNGAPQRASVSSFTVDVAEWNHPPKIAAVANPSVTEGELLQLSIAASDPEQGTLVYELVGDVPAGVTLHPATGVLAWTPTEAQGPTTRTIQVRVTDNGQPAASSTTSLVVTVFEQNLTPSIPGIPSQEVNAEDKVLLLVEATDLDIPRNALTYRLTGGAPAGAAIDAYTGIFTWTPTLSQLGQHAISVEVVDNGVPPRIASTSFQVDVVSPDSPPTISELADQTIREDQALSPVAFVVSDGETEPGELTVTATSNNQWLVPDANIVLGGAGANRTIALWGESDRNGSATITVTVSDGTRAVSDSFVIHVTAVNDAPSFSLSGNPPAVVANVGLQSVSGFATQIAAGPADEAAQSLDFRLQITTATGNLAFAVAPDIDPASGLLTYQPAPNTIGSAIMTVTLVDGGPGIAPDVNTSGSQSFTIVVGPDTWRNHRNPLDVNDDRSIAPIDALLVINELNGRVISDHLGRLPPLSGTLQPPPFLDVNGDGFVSPVDALIVINYLNDQVGLESAGEGEGPTGLVSGPAEPSVTNDLNDDAACAWEELLDLLAHNTLRRRRLQRFQDATVRTPR